MPRSRHQSLLDVSGYIHGTRPRHREGDLLYNLDNEHVPPVSLYVFALLCVDAFLHGSRDSVVPVIAGIRGVALSKLLLRTKTQSCLCWNL